MSKSTSAITGFIITCHPSQSAPSSLFGWGLVPIMNFFSQPFEAENFVSFMCTEPEGISELHNGSNKSNLKYLGIQSTEFLQDFFLPQSEKIGLNS